MKIKIEKLIFEGFGLGREIKGASFNHTQDAALRRKPVFVRKSVPGDELEVGVIKNKKSFAEAMITNVVSPSEQRIKPVCPSFDECGGCEHQNISYENQLKFKEEVFKETLERQGIEVKVEPIIAGSNQSFYYRNSIRFFFLHKKNMKIGFARHNYLYEKGMVEIEKCFLQSETCNLILKSLKECLNDANSDLSLLWQLKIREGKHTGEFMVEIITSGEVLPAQKEILEVLKSIREIKSVYHTIAPNKSLKKLRRRLIFGTPIIYEKIGKYKFQISPESFFQTNSLGIETLYNKIKEFAEVKAGDNILDLYCGTGSIGIYLSTLAKHIVGVEVVPEAIRDAKDNAKINNIHNCEFINIAAEKIFNNPIILNTKYDILILDPPRAGLSKEVIHKLSTINYKRLIYTSCNPATFARDIKIFEELGKKLVKVQPIDMFPQTHHIECVGVIK